MTYIRVLGKTKKEKADAFENLIKKALDSAGYEDFRLGTHKTGREIDIYAKHKVTGHPIICECKAHERPIGSRDIHKFYSIYDREFRIDNRFVGLFFSLSGFTSTALASYDEMDSDVKGRFLLRDADFVLSMLRKAKIVTSDDTLDFILASRTRHCYGERYLICRDGDICWVQIVLTDNNATHYIILGPKGEDVPAFLCNEIGAIDKRLKNLQMLDIHAMKRTLINLLDATTKTPEEISKNTNESIETVMLSLQNLKAQNLLDERTNSKYRLARDLPAFVDIGRQFMGSEDELTFFLSPYADLMMNPSLIEYCGQRYRLDLDTQEKEPLLRLIRISPSALNESLFGSTEKYEATDEHLKELQNLPESERKRIKAIMRQNIVGKLLRRLIADFEEPKYKAILEKREIKGWWTQVFVNLAKRTEQYLSVQSEDIILLLPAESGIGVGQLVSATNYDLFINTGDVLAALGRPEEAIVDYDRAISHLSEPDKLKVAWNNKGLVFASLKKYDEAIKCYEEAIKIDPKLKETWYNKGLAYAYKREHKIAIACYSKALELDPEYSHARIELEKSRESMKCGKSEDQ